MEGSQPKHRDRPESPYVEGIRKKDMDLDPVVEA
jgi:hypothetical protein